MNDFSSSWSAKERRLLFEAEHQPYMQQWLDETKNFQIVEPSDGPVSSVATGVVNGIGKIGVGATTIIDRSVDWVFNPKAPKPLNPNALLPRTERDTRQLIGGILSVDALKHPIGTIVSSGVRVFNIGTSLVTDGIQKVGGGKTLAL